MQLNHLCLPDLCCIVPRCAILCETAVWPRRGHFNPTRASKGARLRVGLLLVESGRRRVLGWYANRYSMRRFALNSCSFRKGLHNPGAAAS
jgi:hypothetical protein